MASLDSLPRDQRAVLQLVLQRGRSYDEIAKLLSIDRAGVRERALAAFDALGPQTRVPAERRALITDYLLGQLPPRVADDTRATARRVGRASAPGRASLASELAPLAAKPLPEIPADGATAPSPRRAATPERPPSRAGRGRRAGAAPRQRRAPGRPRAPAGCGPPADGGAEPRPARLRGAAGSSLLSLGALVVAGVVVAVILIASSQEQQRQHHDRRLASRPRRPRRRPPRPRLDLTTPDTSTTSTNGAKMVAQINLTSPTERQQGRRGRRGAQAGRQGRDRDRRPEHAGRTRQAQRLRGVALQLRQATPTSSASSTRRSAATGALSTAGRAAHQRVALQADAGHASRRRRARRRRARSSSRASSTASSARRASRQQPARGRSSASIELLRGAGAPAACSPPVRE